MSQQNSVIPYPTVLYLCPSCKEHTLWFPAEGFAKCSCCGNDRFDGAHLFIRDDAVGDLVLELLRAQGVTPDVDVIGLTEIMLNELRKKIKR